MAEVLLYGTVYSYSAKEFIENVIKAGGEECTVRVNGDGGELKYGWGCLTKLSQLESVKLINDGEANSMFAFAFCYGKDNEAADHSSFMFHRAGYPAWVEKDPELFTEEDRADLKNKNSFLRKAFEARIDTKIWEEETGVSVDQLFSLSSRVDVTINAKQAKKMGLIDRIIQVTPKKRAEIAAMKEKIEGKSQPLQIAANSKTMDITTLKSEHPSLYAQIFELGKTAGAAEEKDRVEACLTFVEVDPKGVKEAIAAGKPLSAKQMAEFSLKAFSAANKKNLEEDSAAAGATTTAEVATGGKPAAEAKELSDFVDGIKSGIPGFTSNKK